MIFRRVAVAAALMMSVVPAQALELRKDVEEFRLGLESRARTTLQSILGPDSRAVVSVEVKTTEKSSDRGEKKPDAPAPMDLGYVPQMVVPDGRPSAGGGSLLLPEVQSVQIQALIPSDVSPDLVALATKALQMQFAPEKAQVKLTPMEGLAARKPASEAGKPAEEKRSPWIPVAIGGGIAALVLLGAAWILSQGISKTGAALSEGLKGLAPKTGGGAGASATAAGSSGKPESKTVVEESEAAERIRYESAASAQAGNVALISRMVRDNPVRFITCVGSNGEDYRGLRSLMAQLDDVSRQAMRAILSDEALERVNASAEVGDAFGFTLWLQDFCERLATGHLLGTKLVESQVDAANLVVLLKADSNHLLRAAEAVGSPAAWRIASELLQAPVLKSVFTRGNGAVLEGILRSVEVSGGEVQEAAARLITALDGIPERQESEAAKRRFLSGSLLPGVLQALQSMEPGEDESLLEGLAAQSPRLHEMVGDRYWGVAMLDRIPEAVLMQSLEGYEVEDRALILYAIPEARRQKLVSLLPEGMSKVILTDLIDRKQARRDAQERRQAVGFFRGWMDSLKRQADAGMYALSDKTPSPAEPQTQAA